MKQVPRSFPAWIAHFEGGEVTICRLLVIGRVVRAQSDDEVVELPFDGLQIECDGGKNDPISFSHQDYPGFALLTRERSILQEYPFSKHAQTHHQVAEILRRCDDRSRLKATLVFLAGFMVIAILTMNAGGWLLSWAVSRVPKSYELEIGKTTSKEVDEVLLLIKAPTTNAIRKHLSALLERRSSNSYEPKVHIYADPSPNAFVIPGGYFYVSSGLLNMAERPEELIGVLAHEAAHLQRHHGMRILIAHQGHTFLFKWLFGDRSNLLSALSSGANELVNLAYSRELEWEADDAGWNMLVEQGIDPRGLISMFRKFQAADVGESEDPRMLQSHPLLEERIKRLEQKWEGIPKDTRFKPVPDLGWSKTNSPSKEDLMIKWKKLREKLRGKRPLL